MNKYQNENHLKHEIMEQSRHQFIYGYNQEHRNEFLRSLENDYPITENSNKPVALYFDTLGIPKTIDETNKNNYLASISSREYIYFSIATKILEYSMKINSIDEKLSKLIEMINIGASKKSKDIKELINDLKISRDFYYKQYINSITGIRNDFSINDITIPFLKLEMFINLYKEAMNIDSYFGIIIDKKEPFSKQSTQAINKLINGRINKDISIKVALEPGDWETYIDGNGHYIESLHDYGIVEVDDSYQKYIKKLKKY